MNIDKLKMNLLLADKCMTLNELADLSGLNVGTLSKLRNGTRTARPQTVGKIARALGTSVENIIQIKERGA